MTQSQLFAYMMPLNKMSEKECCYCLKTGWEMTMHGLIELRLVNTFTQQGKRYFAVSRG